MTDPASVPSQKSLTKPEAHFVIPANAGIQVCFTQRAVVTKDLEMDSRLRERV